MTKKNKTFKKVMYVNLQEIIYNQINYFVSFYNIYILLYTRENKFWFQDIHA